eukprot:g1376.t1
MENELNQSLDAEIRRGMRVNDDVEVGDINPNSSSMEIVRQGDGAMGGPIAIQLVSPVSNPQERRAERRMRSSRSPLAVRRRLSPVPSSSQQQRNNENDDNNDDNNDGENEEMQVDNRPTLIRNEGGVTIFRDNRRSLHDYMEGSQRIEGEDGISRMSVSTPPRVRRRMRRSSSGEEAFVAQGVPRSIASQIVASLGAVQEEETMGDPRRDLTNFLFSSSSSINSNSNMRNRPSESTTALMQEPIPPHPLLSFLNSSESDSNSNRSRSMFSETFHRHMFADLLAAGGRNSGRNQISPDADLATTVCRSRGLLYMICSALRDNFFVGELEKTSQKSQRKLLNDTRARKNSSASASSNRSGSSNTSGLIRRRARSSSSSLSSGGRGNVPVQRSASRNVPNAISGAAFALDQFISNNANVTSSAPPNTLNSTPSAPPSTSNTATESSILNTTPSAPPSTSNTATESSILNTTPSAPPSASTTTPSAPPVTANTAPSASPSTSNTATESSILNTAPSAPPGVDPDVFFSLPPEMQQEVLAAHGMLPSTARTTTINTTSSSSSSSSSSSQTTYQSQYDEATLAALPDDIREEVLRDERRERERQERAREGATTTNSGTGDSSTSSQSSNQEAHFLSTLPDSLREEVLVTMVDSVLESLPGNFREEAQRLRARYNGLQTSNNDDDDNDDDDDDDDQHPDPPTGVANHDEEQSDDENTGARVHISRVIRRNGSSSLHTMPRGFARRIAQMRSNVHNGAPRFSRLFFAQKKISMKLVQKEVDSMLSAKPNEVEAILRLLYFSARTPRREKIMLESVKGLLSNLSLHRGTRARIVELNLAILRVPFGDRGVFFPPRTIYGGGGAFAAHLVRHRVLLLLKMLTRASQSTLLYWLQSSVHLIDDVAAAAAQGSVGLRSKGKGKGNQSSTSFVASSQSQGGNYNSGAEEKEKEADTEMVATPLERLLDLFQIDAIRRSSAHIRSLMLLCREIVKPLDRKGLEEKVEEKGKKVEEKEEEKTEENEVESKVASPSPTHTNEEKKELQAKGKQEEKKKKKRFLLAPVISPTSLRGFCSIVTVSEASDETFSIAAWIMSRLAAQKRNRVYLLHEMTRIGTSLSSLTLRALQKLGKRLEIRSRIAARNARRAARRAEKERKRKKEKNDISEKNNSLKGRNSEEWKEPELLLEQPQSDQKLLRCFQSLLTLCEDNEMDLRTCKKKLRFSRMWPVLTAVLDKCLSSSGNRLRSSSNSNVNSTSNANSNSNVNDAEENQRQEYVHDSLISMVSQRFLTLIELFFLVNSKNKEELATFCTKHSTLLNVLIKLNPSLLRESFSVMVKEPNCRLSLSFENKREYFREQMKKLKKEREQTIRVPPLELLVRRKDILSSAFQSINSRRAAEMQGRLSIIFEGEEGVDAGGLTREFFEIVAREIFNPAYALFSKSDSGLMQPNEHSKVNTLHLQYFHVVGRIVGKAIAEGYLMKSYWSRSFYKQILGLPVLNEDLEADDPEYYQSLMSLLKVDEDDFEDLELYFSIESSFLGERREVDLKENGRNIQVTKKNVHEYINLVCDYRQRKSIEKQVQYFNRGFYELIPKEQIQIFTGEELELLISGLPDIDIKDLRANTTYQGFTNSSPTIRYFWDCLEEELSPEEKSSFLTFATGSSRVPLGGFKNLEGMRGKKPLSIHKKEGGDARLPSSHTCFNQIELPEYSSKEILTQKLRIALLEGSEGFAFA